MNLTALIIQLIAGALGGNAAGNLPRTSISGHWAIASPGQLEAVWVARCSMPCWVWLELPLHPDWILALLPRRLSPVASAAASRL